ncbi:CTRB1 [Acrasis kona]|uniref:CTRB1 n=1 Tax=Acrasis kona TaxID=1008807 RepID=A0AAW2YHT6_9EUKA
MIKVIILCVLFSLSRALYNGMEVQQGQYPYLVYIMVDPGTEGTYACGGGLISSRYVMSAGHCSFGSVFQVIVGRIDVKGYHKTDLYNVTNVIRPNDFGKEELFDYDDIAIYTLESPILEVENYTQYMDVGLNEPPVGQPLHVAGFGQLAGGEDTSKVHWGITSRAPDQVCIDSFSSYRSEISYCTNDTQMYSCPGDSGSPIVVKLEGSTRWVSVGIDSFGWVGTCGSKRPESVVGKVASMVDFIKQNTQLAPPNFVTVSYTPVATTSAPSVQITSSPVPSLGVTTTAAITTDSPAPKSQQIVDSPKEINAASLLGGTVALLAGIIAVMSITFV